MAWASRPHVSTSVCRWASRGAIGYQHLAEDGFAVLGERLRTEGERQVVKEVLEKVLGTKVGLCSAAV